MSAAAMPIEDDFVHDDEGEHLDQWDDQTHPAPEENVEIEEINLAAAAARAHDRHQRNLAYAAEEMAKRGPNWAVEERERQAERRGDSSGFFERLKAEMDARFVELEAGPKGPCPGCGETQYGSEDPKPCGECRRRQAERESLIASTDIPPRFAWAKGLDAPELATRVRDARAIATIRAGLAAGLKTFTLVGMAGMGKTSAGAALLYELVLRDGRSGAFVDAQELARARAAVKLGAEAEVVDRAKCRHVVLIDEITRAKVGGAFDAVAECVWHRHNENAITIYTAGVATRGELKMALGDDGFNRRLVEGACVVEMVRGK